MLIRLNPGVRKAYPFDEEYVFREGTRRKETAKDTEVKEPTVSDDEIPGASSSIEPLCLLRIQC